MIEIQRAYEEIQARLANVEKAKKVVDKKNRDVLQKYEKTLSNYEEEKHMNENLTKNQSLWQKKCIELKRELDKTVAEKNEEVTSLQDQVRDLMFYMEARDKIEASPEDLQAELRDGTVRVGERKQATTGTSSRGGHRKKRK